MLNIWKIKCVKKLSTESNLKKSEYIQNLKKIKFWHVYDVDFRNT